MSAYYADHKGRIIRKQEITPTSTIAQIKWLQIIIELNIRVNREYISHITRLDKIISDRFEI